MHVVSCLPRPQDAGRMVDFPFYPPPFGRSFRVTIMGRFPLRLLQSIWC
jgi:hypothetical protein